MGTYTNQWFAKYGHVCEIGSTKEDQLPMFEMGGNVFKQIKNMLIRAKMASEVNIRGNRFLRSQKAVDDEHLNHLKYPFILHPFSVMRQYWENMMIVTFILVYLTIPLDIASYCFPLENHLNNLDGWKIFRLTIDLMCCIDVVMNFCTGYVDYGNHVIVMKRSKIAARYCITYFLPDLLSSIPSHLDVLLSRKLLHFEGLFQYCSILKIFRYPTFIRYCNHFSEVHNINVTTYNTLMAVFRYIYYFHLLTCCNMALIGSNRELHEKIYRDNEQYSYFVVWARGVTSRPMDFKDGYLMLLRESTYVATFSFIDEILGESLPKWYNILVWLLSKITFCHLIARLMEMVMSSRSSTRKYLEMVRELREYMMHKQLPIPLQQRLLDYYEFNFQKSYFRESEILNTISGQLKQDLLMHSCRRLVENVEFFQNLPMPLIIRIVSTLSTEIYLVNDIITKANTIGTSMYFIASGGVAVYTKSGHELQHLEDGDYFGEYSLIKHCSVRESTVVAIEICELYRLGYQDFVKAIMPYPDLLDKITKHALERVEMMQYFEERSNIRNY